MYKTSAAGMQQWPLFLAGHPYNAEYKRKKAHGNVNGLSHLLVKELFVLQAESTGIVNLFHLKYAPVTCSKTGQETKTDPTLPQVYDATLKVWKKIDDPNIAIFMHIKMNLL